MGIVAERGLGVFGFQHLSFQEYFVAQFLINRNFKDRDIIKYYSVDEIANRILLYTSNPRFHESLCLAFGWISWKWSFDDYEKFCNSLVASNKNYAIPLGTLLFYDAYNDLVKLPSELIIFTALDSLLFHPSNMIAEQYLIPNLFKLPEEIIKKWMLTHFKDEKSLSKFCQCLLIECEYSFNIHSHDSKWKLSIICQQLSTFQNKSASVEFIIDQTFRRIMMSKYASYAILHRNLSSYFVQHNIYGSKIHLLILSAIIVVSGGIFFHEMLGFSWSPILIYRESSIFHPIIEYLANNEEFDSIKFETLIKQYESVVEEAEPSNTSIEIVDTFIALICLKGLSNLFIIRKYNKYQALTIAFHQIKRATSFIKHFCTKCHNLYIDDQYLFQNAVKSIIKMFFSQFHQDDRAYSRTCETAFQKLFIKWSPLLFISSVSNANNDDKYFESQPESSHVNENRKLNLMEENIESIQSCKDELSIFFTVVPEALQDLYYYIFIDPADKTDSLPLVVLLTQCLIHLENIDKNDPNFFLLSTKFKSKCDNYMLDNYLLVLLSKNNSNNQIKQEDNWQKLIEMEYQRICKANQIEQIEEKDSTLFAASISLARLFQVQYHSSFSNSTKNNITSSVIIEKVFNAITNITDPILQIIVFSMILDMKDPLIFDEKQINQMKLEIINLLNCFLPFLPLLTLTFLVLRYQTTQDVFSIPLQKMIDMIVKKLKKNQAGKAVLMALQQLKNSSNFSDSVEFNSSLLFRCFINVKSLESSEVHVLSMIYLRELAFDVNILQIYINGHYKKNISSFKELNQQSNYSSNDEKIMTVEAAIWITNYLQRSDKSHLFQVIEEMCWRWIIDKEALPLIEKWLIYRNNEDLKYFAHYSALLLFIQHSNLPHLLDIISEMFFIVYEIRWNAYFNQMFNSEIVDLAVLRQIVIKIHRNMSYSSDIYIWITCKEILKLILDLELERIIQNKDHKSQITTKSFLLIINGCSEHLQLDLKDHLHSFIKEQNNIENSLKEEYIAIVIKWLIESQIGNDNSERFSKELYEYVFTYLHDQSVHQVQKAILNGLYSVFINYISSKDHVFLKNNTIIHLEIIISSCENYSEDVLALCLLVYGNYLLQLHQLQIKYHVSDEIHRSLTKLLNSSLTTIISIRAGFCLIFAEQSSIKSYAISNKFGNKWELTLEKEYNILLQQTLYMTHGVIAHDIANHISIHSAEILDTFVRELKSHLDNKCNNSYISDPVPNYIEIANAFSEENFELFKNALQKNSIDETTLKTNLYHYFYYAKEKTDRKEVLKLYERFGVVTNEFIEMLEQAEIYIHVNQINTVSDREVVEQLFNRLEWIVYYTKFEWGLIILEILIKLANAHVISLFEVHQRVSIIIKKFSDDNKLPAWFREDQIFHSLLNLTCIRQKSGATNEAKLLSEDDIDEEFKNEVGRLKRLNLLQ